MSDTDLWIERHRPQTVDDCILPNSPATYFKNMVESKDPPPNMLFSGGPGIGKTTVAKAIARQKDMDLYFINASLYGGIDTLRTDIQRFASTVSFSGTENLSF